jgi:hypothetical protein
MEVIDHLHGLTDPSANTVRRQETPIATNDGDRRVLSQPGGDTGG